MKEIYSSATKVVLLIISITACGGFLLGKLEAKDFMILAIAVFSYYFAKKGTENKNEIPTT